MNHDHQILAIAAGLALVVIGLVALLALIRRGDRRWAYDQAVAEDARNERAHALAPDIDWDAFDQAIALANSASPIYDALAAERLTAELDDDDAIARWLR